MKTRHVSQFKANNTDFVLEHKGLRQGRILIKGCIVTPFCHFDAVLACTEFYFSCSVCDILSESSLLSELTVFVDTCIFQSSRLLETCSKCSHMFLVL